MKIWSVTCTGSRLLAMLTLSALPQLAQAEDFSYNPPGTLKDGSGQGHATEIIYAPNMRFPLAYGPAYANSQLWNPGGIKGPPGSQCSASNYDYPWWDNYCETRQWEMPLCPAGKGHQGQDIRPATCEIDVHPTVATAYAQVTLLQAGFLFIEAPNGQEFGYLHTESEMVSEGEWVSAGQPLSRVSNIFGDSKTTRHLHFHMWQNLAGYGYVYVPPYTSLIPSYLDLMEIEDRPATGRLVDVGCESIRGWGYEPTTPAQTIPVHVYFNGPKSDPQALGVAIEADQPGLDFCGEEALGACEHSFNLELPRSVRDGSVHEIYAYGQTPDLGVTTELEDSPQSLRCDREAIPYGVRRKIGGVQGLANWHFSPFWDGLAVDASEQQALPEGPGLSLEPHFVEDPDQPGGVLADRYRRPGSYQARGDRPRGVETRHPRTRRYHTRKIGRT